MVTDGVQVTDGGVGSLMLWDALRQERRGKYIQRNTQQEWEGTHTHKHPFVKGWERQ